MRVALRGGEVDVERIEGDDGLAPLVFLHEGLGSIGLWRDFPQSVADSTGRAATIYSRFGYGRSDPFPWPRGPDYMHREALEALPELLDALDIDQPVLVGHSDGASIALIYAGQSGWRVSALVLLAPHVFVEDESLAGTEAARETFSTTDLRDRMAKHHDDAEATFRLWNDTWRSPAFRDWNIEEVLPAISVPILVVQGSADRYGTVAQVDAIERGAAGAVERVVLEGCGHSPHLENGPETLRAVTHFLA